MSSVRVMLFATLRQLAGAKFIEMEIQDGINVGAFKKQVGREFPALRESMRTVLIAINREYAFDDAVVPPGGEIALFPPVSGG